MIMRKIFIRLSILVTVVFLQIVAAAQTQTNGLQFFIVGENQFPGCRYLDTADFPKVGYISNSPAFIVTSLLSVATNIAHSVQHYQGKTTQKSEAGVLISMLPADAKRFAELTRENVGRQMVLMLKNRPLIAPLILSPIESGSIQITFSPREDSQALATELQQIVRHQ
jgi:preprotein translocase subunit SecD